MIGLALRCFFVVALLLCALASWGYAGLTALRRDWIFTALLACQGTLTLVSAYLRLQRLRRPRRFVPIPLRSRWPRPLRAIGHALADAYHASRLCPRCRQGLEWQRGSRAHQPRPNVRLAVEELRRLRVIDGGRR